MSRSRLPDEIVYGDSLNAAQQTLIQDYQNGASMLYGYAVIRPEFQSSVAQRLPNSYTPAHRIARRTEVISDLGFGGYRYERRIFR